MSNHESWPDAPTPLADGEWQVTIWDITDSGVLAITLNRPERLNALSFRLLRELQALVDFAAARPDIRVVTLRGAGQQAFCSGDDLYGMEPTPGIDSSITVHHPFLISLRELKKPVVALVNGWALGHGWEIACACDIRLCADNLEVGDHRAQRAIGMNGGTTWFAPRIMGRGRALELLMTGRHMFAEEALQSGWANRVWPLEDFDREAADYINNLTRAAHAQHLRLQGDDRLLRRTLAQGQPRPRGPGLRPLPLLRRRPRRPPKLARETAVGVPGVLG